MIYLAAFVLACSLIIFAFLRAQVLFHAHPPLARNFSDGILSQPEKSFPPGPFQVPLRTMFRDISLSRTMSDISRPVGSVFTAPGIGTNPRWALELKKKFGPVLGIRNGPFKAIIVQDINAAQEIFVKNWQKINARPDDVFFNVIGGRNLSADNMGYGIAFAEGERWRTNRKFALMKVFGKDKIRLLQDKIQGEIDKFCSWMADVAIGTSSTTAIIAPLTTVSALAMNIIGAISCEIRPDPLYNTEADAAAEKHAKMAKSIMDMLHMANQKSVLLSLNRIFAPLRQLEWAGYPKFFEYEDSRFRFSQPYLSLISFSRNTTTARKLLRELVEQREREIQAQGLPEHPTILDLLVSERLQDAEFVDVDTEDIVSMMFGPFKVACFPTEDHQSTALTLHRLVYCRHWHDERNDQLAAPALSQSARRYEATGC